MCVEQYCKDGKIVANKFYNNYGRLIRVSVFAKDRTQYTDEKDKNDFPFPDEIIDFTY